MVFSAKSRSSAGTSSFGSFIWLSSSLRQRGLPHFRNAVSAPADGRYRSTSGWTQGYRAIFRSLVSLIRWTGGASGGVAQERHLSAASSFHIGVSWRRRMASSGRLARVSPRRHITSSQPYPPLRHYATVGEDCASPPK